jgi:hypothetical protein
MLIVKLKKYKRTSFRRRQIEEEEEEEVCFLVLRLFCLWAQRKKKEDDGEDDSPSEKDLLFCCSTSGKHCRLLPLSDSFFFFVFELIDASFFPPFLFWFPEGFDHMILIRSFAG